MVTTELSGFNAAVIRRLDAAHVVVVLDTGGTEVFHGIDLAIEEGREEVIPDDDGGSQASILRYYCGIRPHGAAEPDVWIGTGAMITIVGMGSGGTTFTMAGRGLYDRTEGSTFQIEFEAPPMMTMRRGNEPA